MQIVDLFNIIVNIDFFKLTCLGLTSFYFDLFNFNLFEVLNFKLFEIKIFSFSFSFFFEKISFFCFNYIGVLVILTIYYLLFKNLFLYSFQYYLIQLLFSYKYNSSYSGRNNWIDAFICLLISWKPYNLLYWIADNMLLSTFLIILLLFYNIFFNNIKNIFDEESLMDVSEIYITNFNVVRWISYLFDFIHFGIIIDNLSLLMVIIVLSISTLVHYYSIDYLYSDPWLISFLKYLSGFTTAMLILVTSNNCVLMFMGWEGVGIFSYLLIGFWYTRTLALKAGLKAIIVNKIGDISLLIAIGLLFYFFGTTDFVKLQILINYLNFNKIDFYSINFITYNFSIFSLIAFFLLIAAIGKSAQFGLHTWLPDAMEGPTPVSALIHAATMVTAGVYLIVRLSFIFEQTEFVRNLILIVGAFTALFGSAVACFQYDIKKIIAFSTCSQIGYMFLACGLSAYSVAMFHLFTHAFFKALLFLCAGSIIHAISDQQDIRKMGGLFFLLPITFSGIIIGLFSLMGLPFTSGFYSKDSIIELAFCKNTLIGHYSFSCALLGAFLTAFYCYRFFFYVFFSKTKLSKKLIENIHESGTFLLSVIIILTFLTIFVGFIFKQPLSSPFSYIYFFSSISVHTDNFIFTQYEFFLYYYYLVKKIIFVVPILGFFMSFFFFNYNSYNFFFSNIFKKIKFEKKNSFFFTYLIWYCLQAKGLIDYVYNWIFVKPILNFSYYICYIELDRGWLEFFLVKCPSKLVFYISKIINQSFFNPTLMFLPSMLTILFTVIGFILLYIMEIYLKK